MQESRTIFIWDVHWCFDELKLLIKKIKLKKTDKVYLTWDLINRWPDSYKVLKYLYKRKDQFKVVVWNNEINFLRYLDWKFNKKNKTFKHLKKKIEKKWSSFLIKYLKELPKFIEEKDFILIHWWLNPNKTLEEQDIDEITRIRNWNWKPWYNKYEWGKKIIYWHWAEQWIQIRKNSIWLDSWCTYWSFLTAYILETWEIYQQSALNIYEHVHNKSIFTKIKNIFKRK